MRLPFMKAHAGGRDYVVVNAADTSSTDLAGMAMKLCPRRIGVGSDGLAVIRHIDPGHFAVRCFDPDGAGSSGDDSALRCCARAIETRYGYRAATLLTGDYAGAFQLSGDGIGLRFPAPRRILGPFKLDQRTVYRIWTRTEDVVTFLDDVEKIDCVAEGSALRSRRGPGAEQWEANGVSVNFVQILDAGRLLIRTYDCGVRSERTPSGAGALAAALLARRLGFCADSHIEVEELSGNSLSVQALDPVVGAWLYGPATFICEGEVPWPVGNSDMGTRWRTAGGDEP